MFKYLDGQLNYMNISDIVVKIIKFILQSGLIKKF